MKKHIRFFSLILVVLLCTSSFYSCDDNKEENEKSENNNGENNLQTPSDKGENDMESEKEVLLVRGGLEFELNGSKSEYTVIGKKDYEVKSIVIPSEIDGIPVTKISERAFYNCTELISIEIPDSVKEIGWYAFYNCTELESIKLSANIEDIGIYTFYNCRSLSEISIPERLKSIGSFAFEDCKKLESIKVPADVTYIGENAFAGCSTLKAVTFDKGVKIIDDNAFINCSNIREVYTESVDEWLNTEFYSMWSNPTFYAKGLYIREERLTSLVIPETAEDISAYAFYGCAELERVTFSGNVKKIGIDAFTNCEAIKEVRVNDIASWCGIEFASASSNPIINTSTKLLVGGKLITELVIPEGVRKIFDNAFLGQTTIESVNIPEDVESIGECAFLGCTALESVTIEDGVIEIGDRVFYNCNSLKSISIPKSIEKIGSRAFELCPIEGIYISDIGSWCNIEYAYGSAAPVSSLTVLYLNGEPIRELVIPDGVTQIPNRAFCWQSTVESITFSDSVESIGDYAFFQCTSLIEVRLGKGIKKIGFESFSGCESLNDLHISDLSSWCTVTLGTYKFYSDDPFYTAENLYLGDSLISELVIPEGITEIKPRVFAGKRNIKSIILPSSLKTVGDWAFRDCSGIEKVHIKDIQSWLEMDFANYNDNPLNYGGKLYIDGVMPTEIRIPKSVKEIPELAFYNCSSIIKIVYEGTVTQWNELPKDYNWDKGTGDYTVECSDGTVSKQSNT